MSSVPPNLATGKLTDAVTLMSIASGFIEEVAEGVPTSKIAAKLLNLRLELNDLCWAIETIPGVQ